MIVIKALEWIYGVKPCTCVDDKARVEKAFVELKKTSKGATDSSQAVNQAAAIVALGDEEVQAALTEYKKKTESGEHNKVR
jgi:hypothetical protein